MGSLMNSRGWGRGRNGHTRIDTAKPETLFIIKISLYAEMLEFICSRRGTRGMRSSHARVNVNLNCKIFKLICGVSLTL